MGALTWGFICRSGAIVCEILRYRDRISVRMIRSLRLVFRKNCIRCGAKQFFASHFLFEQSDRHRVILTDTLCRSGSSGGKGRRKTKQIPKRGRPQVLPFSACQKSLAEFAARMPRKESNRFSGDMSSEWACSTPQSRLDATALYPRPHSSSQNQSKRFDFDRSRSEMSLLSRLWGSKGYGACDDAARVSLRLSKDMVL